MSYFYNLPTHHKFGGRYIIELLIGRGRSSAIYKALDLQTRSLVSLKVLDPFLAQDPVSIERFRREAEIVRSLSHPDIVSAYGIETVDEYQVIAMGYFSGEDLKSVLNSHGRCSFAEFIKVARRISRALQACHEMKILHRDIKPQNVLFNQTTGDIKLVDFGISRVNSMSDLTKTGTVIGTPEYMAPELFESNRADTRSDIYALGVLFYELLAGRPPYQGITLSSIMTQAIRGQYESLREIRPDLPEWTELVIQKCLNTDPGSRYQSVQELMHDIDKGENSVARLESRRAKSVCLGCKNRLVAGLFFCHHCGKFLDQVFQPGSYSIIINRVEDQKAFIEFLLKSYPKVSDSLARRKLSALPCLLLNQVSEKSAMAISNELSVYPCEFQMTAKLPSQFKLPRIYLVFCAIPLIEFAPSILSLGALPRGVGSLISLLLLVAMYFKRTRPLVGLKTKRKKSESELIGHMVASAKTLASRNDPNLKTIVANILAKYYRVYRKAKARPEFTGLSAASEAVEGALRLLDSLEKQQSFLNSTSLNTMREKIAAIEAKIQQADQNATSSALLFEMKSKYLASFKDYQAAQDGYYDSYITLLNLNASLQRTEVELEAA